MQITDVPNQSTFEGQEVSFNISTDLSDESGLTFNISGDLTKYFNPNTKVFKWTPGFDDNGNYSITIEATDGSETDSITIDITVNEANVYIDVEDTENITAHEYDEIERQFNHSLKVEYN